MVKTEFPFARTFPYLKNAFRLNGYKILMLPGEQTFTTIYIRKH